MARRGVVAAIASIVTAAACVPTFDDDVALVAAPRILTVRSVPAEAKVGERVELGALVAAPPGANAEVDLEWALCLARKPLTELGPAAEACIETFGSAPPETFQRLGRGARATATIGPDACRRFGPLSASTEAGGVAARPVDPDVTGGYHQPVVAGGELGAALGSVRLACGIIGVPNAEVVRFNQGYRPNENPEIDRLEVVAPGSARVLSGDPASAELTVRASERVDLRVAWATCPREPVCGDGLCTAGENQRSCGADCGSSAKGCTGAETYLWANPETRAVEARREGIRVAWFTSAGAFADEQTGTAEGDADTAASENRWTAPPSPGLVRLWVVLRDDRGGVGWRSLLVQVDP